MPPLLGWSTCAFEFVQLALPHRTRPSMQGRKAFTLQTLPAFDDGEAAAAKAAGFSLHAGVTAAADEHSKLERLCRYLARPAVSTARLSMTPHGLIHYRLKTPYRDGTTHVVFEPLDFIAFAGGAGSEATGASHPVPRGVRPEQSSACTGDSGPTRQPR